MRKFLALAFFLTSATIFAQTTLTGKVVEAETNIPIPGVNIGIKGTTQGTVTDFDGNFSLESSSAQGVLVFSYVGFAGQELPFNGTTNVGTISLEPSALGLDEVVVTSYSLAIDRKTPVAVSTIRAETIETELGSQEYPEILKSTPGVYAHKGGGGFGDSEMRLRGFNSENIAVMINGIPVNDMENGRVYWSNWAGLSDVTRSMQVQRGLGASKVAVPSIGGTVNIVTKSTDAEEGGNALFQMGSYNRLKVGATVSTGLLDNGWAATVSASKTTGEGYVDGTEFEAYSYFLNIAKKIGENHELSFTAFGAPQYHGQRQNSQLIETFRRSERGDKFNADWGYLNGEVEHIEDNFYHKPQMSLNHYWTINDRSSLSTAVYASVGTGGGGGWAGVNKFGLESDYRIGELGPVDLDRIVDENEARGALGSETYLRASRNNHQWYGLLSTYTTELTEDIDLMGGVDLRYYIGEHYTELTNLLGGQYVMNDGDANNPTKIAKVGDKIDYYDEGFVNWIGGFAQAEYSRDDLSAFVSVALSNTGYKRKDYFTYLNSDPERETEYQNFIGYSAKGGANYNLDSNHNIFANIGYFEKAPGFDGVFLNFRNDINADAENQKIFSAELGYGYRSSDLRVNLNVYRTQWNDRTLTQSFTNPDGTTGYANILGINALHQGVELDVNYRPFENLTLSGMASIGDWRWMDDVTDVGIFDEEQELVRTVNLFIEDLKVGGSAQTTFALGADLEVFEGTSVRADWNYADNLFADFDPNNRNSADLGNAWEIPAYGLFDLGVTHKFEFGGIDAMLMTNLNNVFDTQYVSFARDGGTESYRGSTVYYGWGRSFTAGVKLNF